MLLKEVTLTQQTFIGGESLESLMSMASTLYQWPAAPGVESIYPRCVLIRRIAFLLDHNLKIKNVGLPILEKDIDEKLKKLLVQLPVLKVQDEYFKSTDEILTYLSKTIPARNLPFNDELIQSLKKPGPLFRWANEDFLQSLLYARWIDPINYPRFVRTIDWGVEDTSQLDLSLNNTREQVLSYMKKTPVGSFQAAEFEEHLIKQLNKLEIVLSEKEFFNDHCSFPLLNDLTIFMVIQGLLAPSIAQRSILLNDFPRLIQWAKKVEKLTSLNPELRLK